MHVGMLFSLLYECYPTSLQDEVWAYAHVYTVCQKHIFVITLSNTDRLFSIFFTLYLSINYSDVLLHYLVKYSGL